VIAENATLRQVPKGGVHLKWQDDLVGDINSLFVYCDLLEPVFVGDTKAPLLRIVDKPRRVGGNAHRVMNRVLYVPLQKKCFDTVEINIMTDTGQPVAFLPGKSFVVREKNVAYKNAY